MGLLAACQPQARRLLVLDLALSDPVVVSGTAEPWRDAGYTIEYRQFYPHLARTDLARYRVLIYLLGREPEAPSDALTAGDLALLSEWVRAGGVVVLGYDADGEGYLDRWTANRWLEFQGAGIEIGDRLLEDTTVRPLPPTTTGRPEPWAEARSVGDEPLASLYDPFPLDRNHVLTVRDRSQLLAVTGPHTFVRTPRGAAARADAGVAAATRVADGLVVVISRHALGALGPQFRPTTAPILQPDALVRTHDFLTALARWTRRPAEWAHLPPAAHRVPLALAPAPTPPIPVEAAPPPLAPPLGATTIRLPLINDAKLARATSVPDWLRQQGIRALWTPLLVARGGAHVPRSSGALDSMVALLDVGGFNLVAGDADPEGTDSVHARWEEREAVRRAWTDAVSRLQPTSVAWIPVFNASDARWAPGDSSRGPRGEAVPAPCAFDSTLWAGAFAPAYAALGRLAAEQRTLVIALGLDLRGGVFGGLEFCDAAWRRGLARLARTGALEALPPAARYPAIRDAGLLPLYYRALEDELAERVATLRDRVLHQRRDLYFAFRLRQLPADWFTLGLLRGFALPDRPILLFTPEVRTRQALATYRGRDLNLVHAVALQPATLRGRDLPALRRLIFEESDGFWLAPDQGWSEGGPGGPGGPGVAGGPRGAGSRDAARFASDTLARLLRRLVR